MFFPEAVSGADYDLLQHFCSIADGVSASSDARLALRYRGHIKVWGME
jgi:hypothetical protein